MKKKIIYAVLGNANIAADGMESAIRTSWLHGAVHYQKNYMVEIPDSLLDHIEEYAKKHTAEEFAKNVLYPHNPKIAGAIVSKIGTWDVRKLEHSSKYKMLRVLGSYNNGLFIIL